jgi:hypothetical protein
MSSVRPLGSTDVAGKLSKHMLYPVVTVEDIVDLEDVEWDVDSGLPSKRTTHKMHVMKPSVQGTNEGLGIEEGEKPSSGPTGAAIRYLYPLGAVNDRSGPTKAATRMMNDATQAQIPQSDDISQPWQKMIHDTDVNPEEEEGRDLQEDVFTLFFLSEPRSRTFIYSILVIALQYTIYGLLLYSLVEDDDPYRDKDNTLKVPAFVDIYVMVSQVIALLIAVITQEDVMYTIELITVGYDPAVLASHPSATRFYWVASCILRFLEGAVGVGIAFVFIVQSSTVIDIFLNFAAVEFVAGLDNVGFGLAAAGLIGRAAQEATQDAKEIKLPLRKRKHRKTRQLVVLASFVIMAAGLIWIQHKQFNGEYVVGTSCSRIEVSFPEEFRKLEHPLEVTETNTQRQYLTTEFSRINLLKPPPLIYPFFSGEYSTANSFIEHRPVYFERGIDDVTSGTCIIAVSPWRLRSNEFVVWIACYVAR